MRPCRPRPLVVSALLLSVALPASAATFEDGDRLFRVAPALYDLDRGEAFTVDLATADGPGLDLSIGWMRSRVFEVGLQAAYIDLDVDAAAPDPGSWSGFTYGGFLAAHVPTSGSLAPYVVLDALLFGGDFGSPYEFGYGVGAGLGWISDGGAGVDVRLQYDIWNGDYDPGEGGVPGADFAPDGDMLRISVGFVKRF